MELKLVNLKRKIVRRKVIVKKIKNHSDGVRMKIIDKRKGETKHVDLVDKTNEILGISGSSLKKVGSVKTSKAKGKSTSFKSVKGGQGTGMTKGPAKTPTNAPTSGGGGL